MLICYLDSSSPADVDSDSEAVVVSDVVELLLSNLDDAAEYPSRYPLYSPDAYPASYPLLCPCPYPSLLKVILSATATTTRRTIIHESITTFL